MKRFGLLYIFLFCISTTSFAQSSVRSMSDGERRIFYLDINDAEIKLQEYSKERKPNGDSDLEYGSNHFPYEMFKDLILHDERSLKHRFNIEYISEIYSDDEQIKMYIWDTGTGGAVRNFIYDGVFSYMHNNEYHALVNTYKDEYRDSLDEGAYNNIINLGAGPHNIISLPSLDSNKYFCIETSYRTYGYSKYIEAYCIDKNGVISDAEIFQDGNNLTRVLSNHTLGGWGNYSIFGLESKNNTIYRSINYQPKELEGWCFPYPSGKIEVYEYSNNIYNKTKVIYDPADSVYHSLRNYEANIAEFNMKPYTIRVDLLPNGSYRYTSWKNKSISEKPDIVINNGYRSEPTEGNNGVHSIIEKFVFQNNEYFYILSYEMVVYNGHYSCKSLNLTVKRNDTILMTLTPKEHL